MISRAELIAIAINARVWANEGEIDSVLDVLEPIIREDQQQMAEMEEIGDIILKHRAQERDKALADMHAQVEAAPMPGEDGSRYSDGWGDALDMVLDLIDRGEP